MGRRSLTLAVILTMLAGCFGDPNHAIVSSMDASKICMDGGGILDLGSGECICPRGQPWDGAMCEGATPSAPVATGGVYADDKTPKDAVPEEHKAMYDSLPKDVKTSEAKGDDPSLVGPPRLGTTSVSTSQALSTSTATAESVATSTMTSKAVATSTTTSKTVATSTSASSALSTSVSTSKALATSSQVSHKVEASPKAVQAHPPQGTSSAKDAPSSDKKSPSPETSSPHESPVQDQALLKACKAAKGLWKGHEGTCQCPGGRALVGKRCQRLHGNLTAVECLAALYPGKWRKNQCTCPSGQAFSLAHGGCSQGAIQKSSSSEKTSQSLCEKGRHLGRWDGKLGRCQCPSGRIWHQGQCRAKDNMTSRQVCTSDENGGTWAAARKACSCPAGSIWLDQRCQSFQSVPERAACESESNRGQWISASRSCQCPAQRTWNPKTKSCR